MALGLVAECVSGDREGGARVWGMPVRGGNTGVTKGVSRKGGVQDSGGMETPRHSAPRLVAKWLADRSVLPTSVEAVLGYYADSGVFDYTSLWLKRRVDDTTERIIAEAFEEIERELEREFGVESVVFEYDTKLTLPAELTLGYIYRTLMTEASSNRDPVTDSPGGIFQFRVGRWLGRNRENSGATRFGGEIERAEMMTALIVEALIEGDIRDAINDDEYADFDVTLNSTGEVPGRRVAEIAQRVLQDSIGPRFDAFPPEVKEAYSWAVEISERHQAKDEYFRDLITDDGDGAAIERIQEEYKFASFDERPELFEADDLNLPYLKTQYRRVGVIYDGMIEMYRAAGFSISDAFKKSIVLAIIGAQIWLDDVDDYEDDRIEGQLTPVIAEYVVADDPGKAYENTVRITEQYLDLAKQYAMESGTPLTGIAVEYILRSGNPQNLPRS